MYWQINRESVSSLACISSLNPLHRDGSRMKLKVNQRSVQTHTRDMFCVDREDFPLRQHGSSFCSSSRPWIQIKPKTPLISRQLTMNKALNCVGLRFVVRAGLIYKTKTPLISRQLTTNKAFQRGSSFCSLSRPYLQNEDPIDFASVVVWRKALTRFDWLWFDRPVKKITFFWVFVFGSSF